MTFEQVEAYAAHIRIEEITQRLRIDNIVPADGHRRSPSPEPEYDAAGRRTNTRYQRHRERLETERHSLIQTAMRDIPDYRPPHGYSRRAGEGLLKEKVYIPNKDFPGVAFIGQLLGPRGRSLSEMNAQSGANIVIRGKGSVKEGRGRGRERARTYMDQDEPLHCLITADTQQKVDRAKELVLAVIETACTTPEYANERKKEQLRDLAVMNGTFRDDEGRGDGFYQSRELTGDRARICCNICRGGHLGRDCRDRTAGALWRPPPWRQAYPARTEALTGGAADEAYKQLMMEIEGPGRRA